AEVAMSAGLSLQVDDDVVSVEIHQEGGVDGDHPLPIHNHGDGALAEWWNDTFDLSKEEVLDIMDRVGSTDEDDVEYFLRLQNSRFVWAARSNLLVLNPSSQPIVDLYESGRFSEKRKKMIKKGIRSRAEIRLDGTLSPSTSDEENASPDEYASPNRRQKRAKRLDRARKRVEAVAMKTAAARAAATTAESESGSDAESAAHAATEHPSPSLHSAEVVDDSVLDCNPRSPPKRTHAEMPPSRKNPPKVVKVDELEEKHKKIIASFVPGTGKEFYTKPLYDCTMDMICGASPSDDSQTERIFKHRIEAVLGTCIDNSEFLVIVLTPNDDEEMIRALFPDLTIAVSRETMDAYAPKTLRQFEMVEFLQQ
ncbi:hypothetical protein PFISCL1PPCAC_28185, partial [Pristionchus fissidentatus]